MTQGNNWLTMNTTQGRRVTDFGLNISSQVTKKFQSRQGLRAHLGGSGVPPRGPAWRLPVRVVAGRSRRKSQDPLGLYTDT